MFNRRILLKQFGGCLVLSRPGPLFSTSGMAFGEDGIWDVHCHISSGSGGTPEERMAQLVKFADRLGIERMVISLGSPLRPDPAPEELRDENDQVLRAISRFPDRAFGFVYLNPNHLEFSLQELERCVRDGPMVGVKLWVARRCNAPELDPIAERATLLNAPILQHTWLKVGGNSPGESTPYDIVELASRHPQVSFICAHAGGDWEKGIRIVRAAGNVSIDLAGFDPTSGVVEMAVRELGAQRVIFGSDSPGRSFASQLGKVLGAEIPESSRKQIQGGNLRRILTPILKTKGYLV
jgi:predicted TIM-barrel fold metal-dependent hydrolase